MSSSEINEHVWAREQMAAALAGGLDAEEHSRLQSHLSQCASCAEQFDELSRDDKALAEVFEDARPVAGMEDRIIRNLREHAARRRILRLHPAIRYAATGVAAAILLGGFGYVGDRAIRQGTLPGVVAMNGVAKNESNLRLGQAFNRYNAWPESSQSQGRPVFSSQFGEQLRAANETKIDYDGFVGSEAGERSIDRSRSETGKSTMQADAEASGRQLVGPPRLRIDPGAEAQSSWFKPTELSKKADEAGAGGVGGKVTLPPSSSGRPANQAVAAAQPSSPPVTGVPGEGARVAQATEQPAEPAPRQVDSRKIIRNGQMEFEVETFDSAFAMVSKLVQENGGYVGTTQSEKLPNGKVRGVVAVRVPPDKLDSLLLQLRGIGDLKSQKLEVQDVSKHYHDLDGELKAARAMEERLLEMIKSGKGEIRDLLAAEKELANWRGKIDKLVGEMRYYDNLVAMSTLAITLYEKDIRTAAAVVETETIDAGIETPDVETARRQALEAIEEAQGRVIQSDLKRYDAGQFGATIVAEVSPEKAGPLLDRLKQIGKVARLDIQRKQTSAEHSAGARVEKRDTRLNLSLYNLANVAPRVTTNMSIAADDVEEAFKAIARRVEAVEGRVVTSKLDHARAEQVVGTIAFEVPEAVADAIAAELRALGETMRLVVSENPDVQNVTTAKRGWAVQLLSAAGVAPRETATVQIAAEHVADAREKILALAAASDARILASQLNEAKRTDVTAQVDLEVKREQLEALETALAELGDVVTRSVARSTDTQNTIDSKVRILLRLIGAERLTPRETTTLGIEVRDVEASLAQIQSAAEAAGGKVAQSNLTKDREGRSVGRLIVDVPIAQAAMLVDRARATGTVRVAEVSKDAERLEGRLARARVDLTFADSELIVQPGQGPWASVRQALSTSVTGLLWSLQLIVIGFCLVLPWALAVWGGWKLARTWGKAGAETPAA